MADAARVVSAETATKSKKHRIYVSIRIKFFVILAIAIALPVVTALLFLEENSASEEASAPFLAWLRVSQMTIFGVQMPFQVVALVGVAFVAVVVTDMFFTQMLYNKLDALIRWSKELRQGDFARIPVLPKLGHDEVGDLGMELGISASYFQRLSEQAHDSSEEKSVFLTIAAHQLRTPLTAVSWSIDSLLDPKTSEADKQKLQPQLNAQLKRMLLVVGHILASAKIEEGKFGFVFGLSDIVPVIETLIKDFQPLADEKHIALTFEHPATVPQVYIDSERISLAIFDLIANAIDYSGTGGAVTIALKPEDTRVEVSISDTGIGISAKDIPHLFTKFYRGENARHVRPDGSGLGLYLVKNIITNHGSDILVQSDETKGGTRFSFYLSTRKP
ncbi:MAG TPA: HAMP domain-containing sensor histidine kinase [Candidatus Paceibacterota bacterium]|nr:HAMP domain-containing sensor histidine kinase [Candidatus Paceibacterota bacterium]